MKKDWLKDIHDRMADFEVDVPLGCDLREQPQDLWDDICEATATGAVIGSHKKHYRIWIGSSVAAAACLLLFWFLRPGLEQTTEVPVLPAQKTASTDHRFSMEETIFSEESDDAETAVVKKRIITSNKAGEGNNGLKQPEETKPAEEAKPSESRHPESKQEAPLKRYEYIAQTSHKNRKRGPRLSVGLSTSGGFDADDRQRFQGGYAGANTMQSESDWADSPLLGIMVLNHGAETERKVTHHAPVRTSLSLSYRLDERWSIESGITYALVFSDIHEGNASNFIDEKQGLHYVGIPLGATYRLLSWKRLDMYLSSNILAEQCISGQSRKKYIIGNKKRDEEVSAILSHPMQWSVGAKAGVQYNLNSLLSIYAEPGCSYYFDDHSSLETVFKDKVFDFNLNLGLRFTVGK